MQKKSKLRTRLDIDALLSKARQVKTILPNAFSRLISDGIGGVGQLNESVIIFELK